MTITDIIHVITGLMIMVTAALGIPSSPIFVSGYTLYVTAFVGFMLFQSGFTHFCPMAIMLKALGAPEKK